MENKKDSFIYKHFSKNSFPVCLAPMVGLSHVSLRLLIQSYMPASASTFWPTEMLNSRKLPFENLKNTPETLRSDCETDLVPQILGNEQGPIAASVQKLEAEWGASGIDINMGCPVQKALKHNYGVALMGDPIYAAAVVRMAVEASELPVSVKLRAVKESGSVDKLILFIEGLISAGASWITLHPRTPEQKRRGTADWQQIAEVQKQISVPLIGNGDVQTVEDVFQMLHQTGCRKVMVGRALAARPWLLWQVGRQLGYLDPVAHQGRILPQTAEEEAQEYGRCLQVLMHLSKDYFKSEDVVLRKMRFYVRMTSPWLDHGQTLIRVSTKSRSLEEMSFGFENLFKNTLKMSARTELRL